LGLEGKGGIRTYGGFCPEAKGHFVILVDIRGMEGDRNAGGEGLVSKEKGERQDDPEARL